MLICELSLKAESAIILCSDNESVTGLLILNKQRTSVSHLISHLKHLPSWLIYISNLSDRRPAREHNIRLSIADPPGIAPLSVCTLQISLLVCREGLFLAIENQLSDY